MKKEGSPFHKRLYSEACLPRHPRFPGAPWASELGPILRQMIWYNMMIHGQAVSRENDDKLLENKTPTPLGEKEENVDGGHL